MPLGRDVVVMVNGSGAIVMLSVRVAVAFELSFTWTVKFAAPAVVGVPLMLPLAASVSPAGSEPPVVDQLLPPVPPLAARVWLYAVPTVPGCREPVVTISFAPKLTVASPAPIRQSTDRRFIGAPQSGWRPWRSISRSNRVSSHRRARIAKERRTVEVA